MTARWSAASSASVSAEVGEVVVVGMDPVRLVGAEAVDRLDRDRDAELAQGLLVALELPPAAVRSSG